MPDIFISYARKDAAQIAPIIQQLENLGLDVWWDFKISIGRPSFEEIQENLEKSRCVIVFWSRNAVKSRHVYDEAEVGLEEGKLIPVLIERIRPPLGHRSVQNVDLSDWRGDTEDEAWQKLIGYLSVLLNLEFQKVQKYRKELVNGNSLVEIKESEPEPKLRGRYPDSGGTLISYYGAGGKDMRLVRPTVWEATSLLIGSLGIWIAVSSERITLLLLSAANVDIYQSIYIKIFVAIIGLLLFAYSLSIVYGFIRKSKYPLHYRWIDQKVTFRKHPETGSIFARTTKHNSARVTNTTFRGGSGFIRTEYQVYDPPSGELMESVQEFDRSFKLMVRGAGVIPLDSEINVSNLRKLSIETKIPEEFSRRTINFIEEHEIPTEILRKDYSVFEVAIDAPVNYRNIEFQFIDIPIRLAYYRIKMESLISKVHQLNILQKLIEKERVITFGKTFRSPRVGSVIEFVWYWDVDS